MRKKQAQQYTQESFHACLIEMEKTDLSSILIGKKKKKKKTTTRFSGMKRGWVCSVCMKMQTCFRPKGYLLQNQGTQIRQLSQEREQRQQQLLSLVSLSLHIYMYI